MADDMTKLDARDLLVADNLILDPDVKKVDYLLNRCGEHISNKIRLKKRHVKENLCLKTNFFLGETWPKISENKKFVIPIGWVFFSNRLRPEVMLLLLVDDENSTFWQPGEERVAKGYLACCWRFRAEMERC